MRLTRAKFGTYLASAKEMKHFANPRGRLLDSWGSLGSVDPLAELEDMIYLEGW